MKHRIYYSEKEQLFRIETKRFLSKWETIKFYLSTNPEGNLIRAGGFLSYENAEEWMQDRYPVFGNSKSPGKNKNIGFEF